ncbi:TolC family protein [Myxococcaceae bacterium GXIMD 01537]
MKSPNRRPREGSALRAALAALALVPAAALAQQPSAAPAEPAPAPQAPAAAPASRRVLTLAEVMDSARQRNTDLEILKEQVAQANAQVTRAWGYLMPSLSANAAYTRNGTEAVLPLADPTAGYTQQPMDGGSVALIPNRTINITVQPFNQFAVGAQLAVPLIVVPAWLGVANAKDASEATELNVERNRQALLSSVAQAYLGAVTGQRLVELAETQLKATQEQDRIAQVRYKAGAVPKLAPLRSGVDVARATQELRRSQNVYATARLVLRQLAGLEEDFDVVAPADFTPPAGEVDALVQQALSVRQDLAASRIQVDIAQRAVRATKWKWAPTISAVGNYQWTSVAGLTGAQSNWLAQVVASFSLFDGSRIGELREGNARARQAAANNLGLSRQVEREVRVASLDLESARANLETAREQERLAVENATVAEAQFRTGMATYLDVVDANTARFGAGVSRIAEELNVQTATLKLLLALGQGGAA